MCMTGWRRPTPGEKDRLVVARGWEREESQRLEGMRGLSGVEGTFLHLKRDGGYLTTYIC